MKKTIVMLSVMLGSFCSAKAQDIVFNSYVDMDMFAVVVCGAAGNCIDAVSKPVQIGCFATTVGFSMSAGGTYPALSWNVPPPPGAQYTLVRYFDVKPATCAVVDVNGVGDGACFASPTSINVTSPCVLSCTGAPPPPIVNADFVPAGGGNVTVDFY